MGGKQSTAGRPRGAFPGVSTDDSAVPPSAHFGHYRPGGTMGLRSRSVSSVAGMGIDHSATVPFGFYTPRATDSDRAGGGSASDPAHNGNGYQGTGGGHHTDGMLYLGSRASLADTLPLHIAPRWFSAHSGNSIQDHLYCTFYETIVAKQLYRKLSFNNLFIYCRNLIYLTYGKMWLFLCRVGFLCDPLRGLHHLFSGVWSSQII